MKRDAIKTLNSWFKKRNRKPLVMRGARQVGKSTLVRLFATEQKLILAEINLEIHRDLNQIFSSLDLPIIIRAIESLLDLELGPHTLLFLDEVQATPYALQALRYFYELEPDLPVIAAGSLLEFTLEDHHFSMPVGRIQYLHLGPMTFEEYLLHASPGLHKTLTEWDPEEELPLTAHRRLSQFHKEYMLMGGMPKVIDSYLSEKSFKESQEIQLNICKTYMDDFAKYAKQKELMDLQQIFRSLPMNLGRKIKYTHLIADQSSIHTKKLLELLERADIFKSIINSAANGIPLDAEIDRKMRKPLFLDVGLCSSLLGLKWSDMDHSFDKLIHSGNLAEQYVGQHLLAQSHDQTIFYWAREGKKSNAELDYVISQGQHVIPIEVKANKAGSLKSLHQFMYEKKRSLALRFDQNPLSHQTIQTEVSTGYEIKKVTYHLISIPFYTIGRLPHWLEKWRHEYDE
jgi:predicted AAA+ superfamily ATPase